MKFLKSIVRWLSGANHFFRMVIVLVLLVLAAGFFWMGSSSGHTKVTSDLIKNRLEDAKELVTSQYYYTNVVSFENTKDFYGVDLPFTTKGFIVSYEGKISSGFDLDKMEVQVRGRQIILDLPEPEIISHEIDQDSLKIYDEKNSIFNSLTVSDYSGFYKDEIPKVEKDAIDKGLYQTTQENAEKVLKELLELSPEIKEKYTISFQ